MIDLTPLEVRQKKGDFRRALRGYDAELVNDFLDLVADRMEELVRENLSLRDAVGSVQDEIRAYRQKEKALSEALMSAQKLREDARENVEKETALMIREAKLQADAVRDQVARQMVHEEETLRRLRARRAQLVESFRRLLDREFTELDIIEETLELGEGPGSGVAVGPPAVAASAAAPAAHQEPAAEEASLEEPAAEVPAVEDLADGEPADVEPADQELADQELEGQFIDTDLWDDPPEPALEEDLRKGKPKSPAPGEPDEDDPMQEQDWLSSLIEE
jgi:cell division initiation protein